MIVRVSFKSIRRKLRCQMQQFAVKSWFFEFFKKTYVVLIHPGWGWSGTVKSFQSLHHHFYFCPNLHGSGMYWDIPELLKNKNIMMKSKVFLIIQVYCHWCLVSSFFISMQLVHYIKPLLLHSMQRRCFFSHLNTFL